MRLFKPGIFVSLIAICGLLSGCGLQGEREFAQIDPIDPGNVSTDVELEREGKERGTVFGDDGLDLFGLGGGGKKVIEGSGIGVNSFLWRASLDTVSFMPLSSADPFGGVIITDWYSPPDATE